jgi:hypothetical protein
MIKSLKINLLDLCVHSGGMYEAVEILSELSKHCEKYVFEGIQSTFPKVNPQIYHYTITDSIYTKTKNDQEGINMPGMSFSYGFLKQTKDKLFFTFYGVDENHLGKYTEFMRKYLEYSGAERTRQEEEEKKIRLKMIEIDPYGEDDWLEERHILNYKMFEELSHPYDEEPPLIYNTYFQNNYDGFKEELLNDLKQKLIGKKIHFEGDMRSYYDVNGKTIKDPLNNIFVDGKRIKPIYTITVKDVMYNGQHRSQTYYVDLLSEEGLRYGLKKIVNDKTYTKYSKKVQDVLDAIEKERIRKENLKLKHLHHDPWGEESWEDDD